MRTCLPFRSFLPYWSAPSDDGPLFSWAAYSLALPTGVTHTRAGTAYVQDHEGIYRLALTNERRFGGARRVRNLLPGVTNNFSTWGVLGGGNITAAGVITFAVTGNGGAAYSGNILDSGIISSAYSVQLAFTLTSEYKSYSYTAALPTGVMATVRVQAKAGTISDFRIGFYSNSGGFFRPIFVTYGTVPGTCTIQNVQVEYGTVPSELVSVGVLSAPYHGAGVDGVKYFDYENGNTVDVNGVVTEAEGTAIDPDTIYLLDEPAATNQITYSDDLSNAAWTKTDCTAAYNQTGIGGAANAASLVTATGANATCLRASALTIASAKHALAVHIKRSVGTGTVELTLDNGTTWQDITSQVGATYSRIAVDQTLANPQVGIRLVTSGDAVIVGNTGVYYSTSKEVAAAASPIKTTTAAVTRAADVLNFSGADGFDADNETRLEYLDTADVDADDWDGAVDAAPDTYGKLQAVTLYRPGERPA